MRRTQVKVILLTAALVAVLILVSLAAVGSAARNDRLAGVLLSQDVLLAAGLYGLLWWTVLRPLRRVEAYAAAACREPLRSYPLPPAPSFSRGNTNHDILRLRDSIECMARQLRTHLAALRKHESMVSTILDAVPYCIWWKDPRGVYLGCNQAFAEAAGGHQAADIIGKTDYDLPWPKEEVTGYLADDRDVLTSNRAKRHIVEPITHAGGPRRWADTTKVPLVDADGHAYAVLGVADDITERKQAEESLHREKTLTDAIFASMPGLLYVYDEQGRTVRWNGKAGQLLGLTEEQLASARLGDHMLAEDRPRAIAAAEAVMREGQATVEATLLTGHGPATYFFSGVRVVIDGRPHMLGMGIDISERKRAEEALLREKAFNDAMLQGLPGIFGLYDDQGRQVRWNPKTTDISGYSDEDLNGRPALEWVPEDQKERVAAAMRTVMRDGHAEIEADLVMKDGVRVPYFHTGVRLMIEGKPYLLAISIDIAERKRAEGAMLREKALTDALFDSLPGVIHLYDDQRRLVRWNARATQLSGFSDAELMNRPAGAGRTGEDRGRLVDTIDRILRDGRATAETTLVAKAGNPIPIFITGVRVTLNGKPHVLGIGIDITDRKRVEETLRREKAFTDAVFDNVPAVLSLYDDTGRLVRWNRRSNEITGFSDEEFGRRLVGDAQPPEERDRIAAAVHQTLTEGHAVTEASLLTKSGDRIPFYYTGVRVMLDGRPHILSIGVDISERKRAEEHLRRALEQAESANRAKDHFLAAASHELRTPLTPVLLLTSSLEADPTLPGNVRHDLGVIREHVEVEKRLIGDLLDFTAIHAGKLHVRPVPIDVHDVLRAALRTCQESIERKGLRVDARLDARRHHTLADADRLRQVFWNLLQNACKFTPDHCPISVRTTDDDDGRTLRVEVSDTGRGMDDETLRRLFRPFEQGPRDERIQHYGGLGLGLAISKTLVEAHGGSISATSPGPGRGSSFTVTLPLLYAGAEHGAAPDSSSPNPQPATRNPQSLKLLLVEDHPLTLKTLARLLKAEGHDVTTAMSVAEALRLAAADRFDLVISDIGLPDGSGLDLMPALRDRHGLPGIALSGFGADADLEASAKAGFLAHVTKPVTIEALRDVLNRFAATPAPTG